MPIENEKNKTKDQFFLNNHIDLIIKYHKKNENDEGGRIVAFIVSPRSIKHSNVGDSGPGSELEACAKAPENTLP